MYFRSTEEIKGGYNSFSSSLSRGDAAYPYKRDVYGRKNGLSNNGLIESYESWARACADLNATATGSVCPRLYIKTNGEGYKGLKTVKVLGERKYHLSSKLRLTAGEQIEEVVNHRILDLLNNPNEHLDGKQLITGTQLYKEVIGTSYWLVTLDLLGTPQDIHLLRSQDVTVERDETGKPIGVKCGKEKFSLKGEDYLIINFPFLALTDPFFFEGVSPLAAVWDTVSTMAKLDATQAALLDNDALPQVLVSPANSDGYMGENEQRRFAQRWRQSFLRGANGLALSEEPVNVQKLSFSPRDLSALQIKAKGKEEICGVFGIPLALMSDSNFTYATLNASRMQHALAAVKPRVDAIEARLNKLLVPLFDNSGKLFLAFDDPSPENREERRQEIVSFCGARPVITQNEGRKELGLPPVEGGDELNPIQPGMQGLLDTPDPETELEPVAEPVDTATAPAADVQSTALNGAQVASLLEIVNSITGGLIPLETGRAAIIAAFPGMSLDQVNAIVSPLVGFKPETEKPDPVPPSPETDQPKAKAYNPEEEVPEGKELAKVVSDFFNEKAKQVNKSLSKFESKALPDKFVHLEEWTKELDERCQPVVELYVSKSGKQTIERVGASEDVFDVTNPLVRDAIEQASFDFCEATLETTDKEVTRALDELREQLGDGLLSGDRLTDLTNRVKEVFKNLAQSHAERLAQTEAARAHHLGWLLACEASGVVVGKKWLLSSDACEACQKVYQETKGKKVGLRENFTTLTEGREAYRDIPYPPLHPQCRCTVTEVLDIDEEA